MRKIKFRRYAHIENKMEYITNMSFDKKTNEVIWTANNFINGVRSPSSSPIMQFTGIIDKNNREIYEGDIVELDAKFAKTQGYSSTISEVIWDEDGALFDTPRIQYALSQHNSKHFTIIGNIYQNPNILEEGIKIKPLNTREIDLAKRIDRSIRAYVKTNAEKIRTYDYKDLGFSLKIHTKTKINIDDDFVLHLYYTQDFCKNLIGSIHCSKEELIDNDFKLDNNKNIPTPIIKLIDSARKNAYYRFKPYPLPSGRRPLIRPITSIELQYLPYDDYKVLIALKKTFYRYWKFLTNKRYCKSLKDIFPDIKVNLNFMIYKDKNNEYVFNLYESTINDVVACLKVGLWDLVNLWVEVKSTDTKHKTIVPKTIFNLWNNIRYKYIKETK